MLRYMIVFLISFLAPLFLLQRIIPLRRPLDLAPVENRVMECPAPPRQRTEERPWDAETVLAELDATIRSLSELPPEHPSTVSDEETAALDGGEPEKKKSATTKKKAAAASADQSR